MLPGTRNEIRAILREVLGERAVKVYLFGSWALGNASVVSDIDLAIESEIPLPRGTLARLRERLEDSHVPYRVEVVDLQEVEPAFRDRILKEGVRWSG